MADETTTIATASQASTAQGDSVSPPAGASDKPASPQINPADLEKELQKVRSQMGREVAEARRQAEEARRQAQAIAQRDREQRLSGMDDLERAQFERNEAAQHIQHLQQQLVDAQNAREREQALNNLASEYGVPREVLEEATDYRDAELRARAYEKEQLEERINAKVEERIRKAEANAPDIGGGRPSTATSRYDDELREAWKRKDAHSYVLGILQGRSKK